jgi:hypothetical protein
MGTTANGTLQNLQLLAAYLFLDAQRAATTRRRAAIKQTEQRVLK